MLLQVDYTSISAFVTLIYRGHNKLGYMHNNYSSNELSVFTSQSHNVDDQVLAKQPWTSPWCKRFVPSKQAFFLRN